MIKRVKKITIGIVGLSLVAAMAIGGTLSFMTKETEKRANNFTFSSKNGLKAILTEPEWDGVVDYEYDVNGTITPIYAYIDHDKNPTTPNVPVYGYEEGDLSKPVTDKANINGTTERPLMDSKNPAYQVPIYGDKASQKMIPGSIAPKNPIITNTGTITDEWVAAKTTFVYAEGTMKAGQPLSTLDLQKVVDVMEIDYKTETADKWERVDGTATTLSQVFFYKDILVKDANADDVGLYGGSTTPIFTTVSVRNSATSEQIEALENMGGFAIWIEGFATQSATSDSFSSFKSWGFDEGNVIFTNTPTTTSPADVARPGIVPAN